MAIVVKWRLDGAYLSDAVLSEGVPYTRWTHKQAEAMRFANQAGFRAWALHRGLMMRSEAPGWWELLRYVRLVPRKRNASPKP